MGWPVAGVAQLALHAVNGHRCAPSANPRHHGFCDCGKRLPKPEPAPAPVVPARHPERWLEPARGTLPTYPDRVMARHVQAAAEYGDSWLTRSLIDLAAEIPEEGLDVAGWAMLVGERLTELDPRARGPAADLIERLVLLGAQTTATADRLAAIIAHHQAPR